jgi:putative transposase
MVAKGVATCPPEKRKQLLECVKTPSENGQMKESSQASEHLEANDSITLPDTLRHKELVANPLLTQNRQNEFATAECLPKDKKTTLNAKSPTCSQSSQNIESSPTLDQGSTSNVEVSVPFWSSQAREWSPRLWLPTETGCAASRSNWWNGSFNSMESSSWFSIKKWTPRDSPNLQRTSLPLSTFSIAESTAKGSTKLKKTPKLRKKLPANCSKRVRLTPPPEVAAKLKQWFGSARFTYNWALGCIKDKPKEYKKTDLYWLRKRFINECNIPKDRRFLLDTPKHVRDGAIADLTMAYKVNFAKGTSFEIKFRKKKDGNQSITIPSDAIKLWDMEKGEMKMYPTYLKNKIAFHVKRNQKAPQNIEYDCKLLLDKLGRFSLSIAYHEPVCESQADKGSVCSIDPGVRTFLTVYSPTPGECYKIGDRDISRICRLCKHFDNLTSSRDTEKNKRKKKSRDKALIRLRERIRNLVDEVHKKAVNFLVSRYQHIIIPPFEVSNMIRRADRKIHSSTVRKMMCWSHYRFRQRLLFKSSLKGTHVHVLGEEYTSKTCTHCQHIKGDLGGAKVYRCQHCGLEADRDVCGARNILLKNIQSVRGPKDL